MKQPQHPFTVIVSEHEGLWIAEGMGQDVSFCTQARPHYNTPTDALTMAADALTTVALEDEDDPAEEFVHVVAVRDRQPSTTGLPLATSDRRAAALQESLQGVVDLILRVGGWMKHEDQEILRAAQRELDGQR